MKKNIILYGIITIMLLAIMPMVLGETETYKVNQDEMFIHTKEQR